jgi:hypothetical protein
MKYLLWVLGIPIALVLTLLILQTLAAERVEVVELYTLDAAGERHATRLWIIDDEGYQYLRVGANGSAWFERLMQNGQIQLSRSERTQSYTVLQRPDKSEKINAMMQAKYTWGDTFFATLMGSREGSIPLELHPSN